jgi:capsid portal protein
MGKGKTKDKKAAATANVKTHAHAFTFGEPEPIDRAALLEYAQVWNNGRWYEPPLSLLGLSNMLRSAPHHSSAIFIKRNLLLSSFVPTSYLSAADFEAFATDYLVFANAYGGS